MAHDALSISSALSVKGLKKSYGGLAATRDVDLDIAPGHVHAIIGPNGAGKTTLLSLLSGALAADAGEVFLFGETMHGRAEQSRVSAGLARSFQITSVFDELTVLENLQVAVQRRQHVSYGFFHGSAQDKEAREAALSVARRVGLEKFAHQLSSQLSHGARRRLDVGLAIACKPRVLLMDEPMAGMGHEESGEMIALIQSLKQELTVVLVEHDMDAVFALADRITVLVQGAVLATGSVDEIRNNAEVKLAYLGEEEEDGEEDGEEMREETQ
ncbi:ABC-type branched-chain amino acid transport system, ATPase component [Herbaspirillum sp. CF444]|uniref:ABC transporter ATP-binding protein n=1 Tax=Herbaspirillum sp. CF444 TaxID=1144319 RepID=UPI0002725E3F|nr:ABC transporter ATP-binding protein [Herbaspirillum sp. CF444]EJL80912.1 ABC-type branched-chain amino acid transport system, ATPase component [Herbaspirillum sp. CF444]